jgi:hypothetical protein
MSPRTGLIWSLRDFSFQFPENKLLEDVLSNKTSADKIFGKCFAGTIPETLRNFEISGL